MLSRRNFLGYLGIGGLGSVYFDFKKVSSFPSSSTEEVELRVYGGASLQDRRLLLTRRVPVRMERRSAVADWYGPSGLELVLQGPIAVTAVTCQVPKALRFIRDEVALSVAYPVLLRKKGDTVTILLPERLMSVS